MPTNKLAMENKISLHNAEYITQAICKNNYLLISGFRFIRHTSKPGPDSDSDPDSDSKKIRTREKPGLGLEKNPDSCLTKPGLDF
jgi:hypothetical protein